MQKLTSLSPLGTTSIGLKERLDTSLVQPSSAEPLNAMVDVCQPKPDGHWRREIYPGFRPGVEPNRLRVPVVDVEGKPLMPCTPVRARILIKKRKAKPKWSKLGIFYIQLNYTVNPNNQILVAGIDPGSKYEAISVVGNKATVLNIMLEAVDWVKKALEQRRRMRRARRYRNARRRPCRFDNRLSNKRWIPPSTKARWNAKLRVISHLKKIIPLSHAVIEDIKAATKKECKKWNSNFSPLEVGKQYFYSALKAMNLEVTVKTGNETKAFRDSLGLKKLKNKSKPVFESQCIDSWCLAAMVTGAKYPTTKSIYYAVPLRWHRRQLHRFEPEGGVRRRYGGTMSLGLKKGTLVRHLKYGLCYIGGNLRNRFSLHSLKTGERLTQNAKKKDFRILTRIAFRTQFLPVLSGGVSLGGFR